MQLRRLRTVLVASLLVSGCATTVTPMPDAGSDAPVALDAGPPPDAYAAVPDAPACDLSPVPSPLPMLAGTFLVEGPETMPPVGTGGDPSGTWIFDRLTIYVSETAGEMFDAAESSISGTAWAAFEDMNVRMETDFVLRLVGTLAGVVSRANLTRVSGAYAVDPTGVTFTPTCAQGGSMMSGAMSSFGFILEGERGTLVIRSVGMLGPTTIVLEGTRVP